MSRVIPPRCAVAVALAGTLVSPVLSCGGDSPAGPSTPAALELVNGRWFAGGHFVERTMYVVDEEISLSPPSRIDERIDLGGGWVVPPFAESHTHTLTARVERVAEFLGSGIFYAAVMNDFVSNWTAVRDRFNRPDGIDVRIALAGFTASDGHPLQVGLASGRSVDDLDGDWLNLIDTMADLDARWSAFLATGSDVVKVFLVNSDEYVVRHGNPDVSSRYRGLDPGLLPAIVSRARAAGLPVAAHVRTAIDFRVAVAAGVDEIAHLPGFSMGPAGLSEVDDSTLLAELENPNRFTITLADAGDAAAAGIAVHTTLLGPLIPDPGLPPALEDLARRAIEVSRGVQRTNLATLGQAGVTLLLGSDEGEDDVISEALYVAGLGVLEPREILTALCTTGPRRLFPGRAIGRFDEGYEASFLVLGSDPLVDLAALRDVRRSMKQGRWIRR